MTNQNQTLEQRFESLPEVQKDKGLWQNKFHEFDVYTHTTEFVKYLKGLTNEPDMIASGYLHDIGKPVVAKPKYKDGKLLEKSLGISYNEFDDHEIVGEEMVKKMDSSLFKEYGLNQEKIAKLVGSHYLPMDGIKKMRETKTFNDFKKSYEDLEHTLKQTGYKSEVLAMFTADKLAQGKFCTDKDELFAIHNYLANSKGSLENIYKMQKQAYGGKE